MIFDSKEHQQQVLSLLNNAQFPGTATEKVMELKQAILSAQIVEPGRASVLNTSSEAQQ